MCSWYGWNVQVGRTTSTVSARRQVDPRSPKGILVSCASVAGTVGAGCPPLSSRYLSSLTAAQLISPQLASAQLTSPQPRSPRLGSPYLSSDSVSSPHLSSDRLASVHLTSVQIASIQLTSAQIASARLFSLQRTSPQLISRQAEPSAQLTSAQLTGHSAITSTTLLSLYRTLKQYCDTSLG